MGHSRYVSESHKLMIKLRQNSSEKMAEKRSGRSRVPGMGVGRSECSKSQRDIQGPHQRRKRPLVKEIYQA